MSVGNHSIVSTKEARKLLGDTAKDMTDDQIEETITDLEILAKYILREIAEGRLKTPES